MDIDRIFDDLPEAPTINQIIDAVLIGLNQSSEGKERPFEGVDRFTDLIVNQIIGDMEYYDLAKMTRDELYNCPESCLFSLTTYGRRIANNGGWLSHLEGEEKERQQKEQRDNERH